MFLGEFLCGIVYSCLRNENVASRKLNPLWYLIPTFFEFTASSLLFLGLTQIAASVYQMLKGSLVVVTAILSIFFLHRKLITHHYLGITIVVTGALLVGTSQRSNGGNQETNHMFGLVVTLVGYLFYGCHIVIQEALMTKAQIHPLQLAGWEGFWGLILFSIILPIFQ